MFPLGNSFWLIVGAALLVGCGERPPVPVADQGGAEPEAGAIKRRPAAELPAIGDYLPKLDNKRIEIAPPAKWNIMPRDERYLARFVHGKVSELPRITVTAWDTPVPEITELTEANWSRLAAELTAQMTKDKKTVPEDPKPIYLGETLFLRHVRRAKLQSGDNVVVQALDTVKGGRIYTVELIANIDAPRAEEYEASLKKWRNEGYAVAAGLKFGGDAAPMAEPAAETPAPTPSTDKPPEENAQP